MQTLTSPISASSDKNELDFPVSIAPMMEWTDRHYRFLMRQFTRRTILYTEMVTAEAIIRGNRDKLLDKSSDNPTVLQLGGSDPEKIFQAARIARDYDYRAMNLNVGCPSDRVSDGRFGACLMADPELVSDIMIAMREGSSLPVSVKNRIGINGRESYEDLEKFTEIVCNRGNVEHFIIHARIAILGGLSPAENREIPPLRYEDVFRLKKTFPRLKIEINGGIKTWQEVISMLNEGMDGVMIGRKAYEDPSMFFQADSLFPTDGEPGMWALPRGESNESNTSWEKTKSIDWEIIQESIRRYLEDWVSGGGCVHHVLRHCMGFFHGRPGGRKFRRYLSENMHRDTKNVNLFSEAMREMQFQSRTNPGVPRSPNTNPVTVG